MDPKAEYMHMCRLRFLMRKWMRGERWEPTETWQNPFKVAKLQYGIKGRSHAEIFNNFGEFMDQLLG